ncbi:hypothetical protein CMI41_04940 [Candidatus Pacearchaeota archaeon]|nr:hypothetical protein [Candidatus Pacearchaeota archaeon]|tara:strand:- start:3771 stop:4577 length:807 start_codon:yes stop_codon:yes gene_type:complete
MIKQKRIKQTTLIQLNIRKIESTKDESNRFMNFWNSLKGVPRHENTNTKIYKNCVAMFTEMQKGTFVSKRKNLKKFIEGKLDTAFITKKWSQVEILRALRRLSKYYENGRDAVPIQSLKTLLYNPSHPKEFLSSFLFYASQNHSNYSRKKKKVQYNISRNEFENFADLLNIKNDSKKKDRLSLMLVKMCNWYDSLPEEENLGYGFKQFLPTVEKLYDDYYHWLVDQNWITTMNLACLDIHLNIFRSYLDDKWDSSQVAYDGKNMSDFL